jgi:SulP family sulfate permease
LVKFIPYPITIGFTTGIAVTLFTGQLGDFFGFQIANLPANFIGKLIAYGQNIGTISIYTTIIGLGSLLLIVVWNRYNRYIPGSLVALVVATLFVKFGQWPVQTIGGRFGELSAAFPTMQIPVLDFAMVRGLVGPALSIAILGSIESLLSAVVADGMTGRRHNSNMELVAQGTGNLVSALFGGLPVTGAIARTAANVRSGGRTPIAGMVHAVTVLVCTLVFMPMVKHVPMTTLAAILFTVCYNMVEWRSIKELLRAPKSDINVLLATFLFTVIFDLVVAIEVGLALAVLLFMKRMIEVTDVIDISDSVNYNQPDDCQLPVELADKVMVYRIQGPFFFGAANSFLNVEKQLNREIRAIIFCMEEAQAMDATGLHALLVFLHTCRKMKIEVFIVGAKEQPMRAMAKGRILEMVNDKHIYQTKEEAFAYIVSVQQHMINIEKYTHRWHHLHESPSDHNKKS